MHTHDSEGKLVFFVCQFLRRNRPPVEITQPPSLDMYTVLLKMRRRLLQHFMNSAAKKGIETEARLLIKYLYFFN